MVYLKYAEKQECFYNFLVDIKLEKLTITVFLQ